MNRIVLGRANVFSPFNICCMQVLLPHSSVEHVLYEHVPFRILSLVL